MTSVHATELVLAIFGSVMASSGFWAIIMKRADRRSASNRLLLGLAHERILRVGQRYVSRGWVSYDEYEDFIHYLYEPYAEFGGNGMVERIKNDVGKLPLRPSRPDAKMEVIHE